MDIRHFGLTDIRHALRAGWLTAQQTRTTSTLYASIFTLTGALILGLLLAYGLTPFIIAAAGGFMLIGPIVLAGFFGIAQHHATGQPLGMSSIIAGYRHAANALWVIALVCTLLFMIFLTDAATLYSFMVGRTPVWLTQTATPANLPGVQHFLLWGSISGLFIAFMLYCVSVFSVPLLCERRTGLVQAVMASVRAVFSNFIAAMTWAALLALITMSSILLLPLLLLTLPWLAYASRALYQHVFPQAGA
jgi:uncharacterized membrane protein